MRFVYPFYKLLILLLGFASCQNFQTSEVALTPLAQHPNGMLYVGMETCLECHADLVQSHLLTPHYNTSKQTTLGALENLLANSNTTVKLNDGTSLFIEKEGQQVVQKAFAPNSQEPLYAKTMDIAIGSGKKIGQTFLNWEESSLFQLQASHFNPLNQWINSPGYGSFLAPKRPIFPRCLECHSTYAQAENPSSPMENNRYVQNQIVYGIDCQRCHGPVVEHVNYHRKNPMDSIGKNILKYSQLSREQRLDMCALCHQGTLEQSNQKSFAFQPGDRLNNFRTQINTQANKQVADVHANQVALLRSSACFQQTKTMDCMTCHNPHRAEAGNRVKFNAICASCHQGVTHAPAENATLLKTSFSDCVQCHMPLQDSSMMKLELELDSLFPVQVRTHKIGIYGE
jgi:predicted CXXCH cytochrome family protein